MRSWVGPTNSPPASATLPWPMWWLSDAAADPVTRLEHDDPVPGVDEPAGGGQPGEAGADHDDVGVQRRRGGRGRGTAGSAAAAAARRTRRGRSGGTGERSCQSVEHVLAVPAQRNRLARPRRGNPSSLGLAPPSGSPVDHVDRVGRRRHGPVLEPGDVGVARDRCASVLLRVDVPDDADPVAAHRDVGERLPGLSLLGRGVDVERSRRSSRSSPPPRRPWRRSCSASPTCTCPGSTGTPGRPPGPGPARAPAGRAYAGRAAGCTSPGSAWRRSAPLAPLVLPAGGFGSAISYHPP